MAASPPTSDTFARVEKLMRRDLKLGSDIEINPTTPFFGSNADIDSLDILLLLGSIEKEFGLRIPTSGRWFITSISTAHGARPAVPAQRGWPAANPVYLAGCRTVSRFDS